MTFNKALVITFSLFFLSWNTLAQGPVTKKVLFIGNSYTGNNNLPQLTANVAISVGDTLIIDQHTPGGERLFEHAVNATAMQKIFSADWDHVVLQAQSQEPSWSDNQVQQEVFPYATILCDSIRANDPCTRPVFYMTWGRENGDASNCSGLPSVCTYEGMDSVLNQNYQIMGADNDAFVSPVGAVWHYIRDNHPGIDLYAVDESHPSQAGSYAGACTFYTILFRKDPTLVSYRSTVDSLQASIIRAAVKTVVFDDLLQWNVGEFDPMADFTYADSAMTYSFANQSVNADAYSWNFGDGDTSTDESPVHVYNTYGTFEVQLLVSQCGMTDTSKVTIEIIDTTSTGILNASTYGVEVSISPNPFSNQAVLTFSDLPNENYSVELYTITGQLIQTYENVQGDQVFLNRNAWESGLYLILLRNEGQVVANKKLLIQ